MASPRPFTAAWKYLGFAAAAPTMIIALPTHEAPRWTGPGKLRARGGTGGIPDLRYPRLEVRANSTQPGGGPPRDQPPKNGGRSDDIESDDEDGFSSDDDESDDEERGGAGPKPSHSATASASSTLGAGPDMTALPEKLPGMQTPEEATREHWLIAVGSVGRFLHSFVASRNIH
jgi:hypothetical protein